MEGEKAAYMSIEVRKEPVDVACCYSKKASGVALVTYRKKRT